MLTVLLVTGAIFLAHSYGRSVVPLLLLRCNGLDYTSFVTGSASLGMFHALSRWDA